MKKNYIKPSLLAETFVAENIMTEAEERISTGMGVYLNGQQYQFTLNENNQLNTIKISDYVGK